jgi:hypothetical protein
LCPRVILIGSHLHLLPYSFLLNNKRRSIILIKYVEANELHFHNFNDNLWERRGVKMDIVSLETIFWISVGSSSSVRTGKNSHLNVLCWVQVYQNIWKCFSQYTQGFISTIQILGIQFLEFCHYRKTYWAPCLESATFIAR